MSIVLNGTTGITTPTIAATSASTFTGTLALPAGGLNVGSGQLAVDASGRVTMSSQPAFCAQASGGYQTTSPVPFPTTKVNTGSHFNTSTYRFTAPVAGRYVFILFMYFDNNTALNGTARIRINGASNQAYIYMEGFTGGDQTSSMTTMLQLAANDYIDVLYEGSRQYFGGSQETQLTGFLIG